MKHTLLLLFFGLVLALPHGRSQSLLAVEPAIVNKQINIDLLDTDYEEVAKVTVRNTSERLLQLRYDRLVVQQPGEWETIVCDNLTAFPPFMVPNGEARQVSNTPVQLAPGQTFDLYLTIKPQGQSGQATIEVPFSLITDPGKVVQTAVFHVRFDDLQALTPPAPVPPVVAATNGNGKTPSIRLYPNPTTDRFYVSLPRNQQLGRIEVLNTLGRRVRTFDQTAEGASYDISGLPEGVYLVSLFDDKGKIIRTLRLLHRNFRP